MMRHRYKMTTVKAILLMKLTFILFSLVMADGNIVGVTVDTNDWTDVKWWNISHTDILTKEENNVTLHITEEKNILDIIQPVTNSVDKSYLGYIHLTNCRFATVLDLPLSRLNITNVLIVKQPCYINNPGSTTLKLFTSCQWTTRMMTDIVLHLSWNSLLVFYDDTVDDKCVRDLLTLFSSNSVRCQLCNIDVMIKENNIKEVNRFSQTRILVFASYEKTRQLLQVIKAGGIEKMRYWVIYIYDLDSKTLDDVEDMDNVVLIRQPFPELTNGTSVYAEDSPVTPAYLRTAVKFLQNARETYINIGPNGFPKQIEYIIYTNFTAAPDDVLMWDNVNGLNWDKELILDTIFTEFGNRHLRIATQEAKPFTIKGENETEFTGFCIDILNELSKGFNFSYTFVEPLDGLWGAPNPDGSWNGMVGMVQRGEVDFAVGPFTITSLRETVIDFTIPYMEDGAGILTKRPPDEISNMFKMFEPFSKIVWMAIVVAITVVGVMLYLVNRWSPYSAYNQSESPVSKDEVKLINNLWLIYGFFTELGGVPHPSSYSGRCILGFWWLFTILILSAYTANLAAFLTVTIAQNPINSVQELVEHQEYQPLVKIGTNLHSLFQKSAGGIYGNIWNKMSSMPEVRDSDTAFTMVKNDLIAFMTDRAQLDYVMLHDCGTYALADEIFNTAGYGFVLPENAPFKKAFNKGLMRMQESGLIDKWRKRWWSSLLECTNSQALGLDSLSGLFFFYGGVIVASFCCLIFEVYIFNRCRKKYANTSYERGDIKLDSLQSTSETSISEDTNEYQSDLSNIKYSNHISDSLNSLKKRK